MRIGGYITNKSFKETEVSGTLDESIENSNGKPRLGLTFRGLLGGTKRLAIYYDPSGSPKMGIKDGRQFRNVKLIYSDEVRLRIVYEKFRVFNVATLYVSDPSELYRIEATKLPVGFNDFSNPKCYNVRFWRKMETLMLENGTSYDHGRLGVEIAYTIVKNLLRTYEFVIPEPSRGGRDLYSNDGQISVQARLLYDFRQFRPLGAAEAVRMQLKALLRKLGQDFTFNARMSLGLALLSYFDESDGMLRTILVRRPRTAKL